MKVRLIERGAGAEQTREVTVNQDDFLIGRGTDCDLRLHESTISRHHCIIRPGGDEATLVDLGSINGSYLNNQRVRSTAPLHTGDDLQLGTRHFLVVLGDDDWVDLANLPGENPLAATLRLRDLPKR